ncbi:phenazine biosynthesis protein PhzF family [Caldicellulosiruptor saccharolyticus DSM 8903]|uniref:Phenazine biosynthesis protein PhzF family n=1 Tax=Caldicellulosiruptor saccharolyticus (strain ATCC 43494 / DSM 8903 / Tp8T 6331) TaxID=351627 RepID=A4XHA2_CALS8|nr:MULTISPECIES: PhzF family phenazine biosynthesis protein [Caldicellulosiruptor]ABP66287.1 phenazine biosynthesis protein PhzF family [Caldicellulosiruptor saccharolyticus DSM 8903]
MKLYQVDAFTDKLFKGNPAGVCILEDSLSEEVMQNIAMEMNLSETAFLQNQGDYYLLRWFTPETEVDLCGHATLASAHILWEEGYVEKEKEIVFHTKSGILKAKREGEYITLDFPLEEPKATSVPEYLVKALNIPLLYVGKNRMDYLVETESEEILRNLKPDFELLKKVDTRGVIVTAKSSSPEFDFVSRFFAPKVGVNEDPVTGSAHTALAPYWSKKLQKTQLVAYQASKRGGVLKLRIDDQRVYISGKAITFFKAEIKDCQ